MHLILKPIYIFNIWFYKELFFNDTQLAVLSYDNWGQGSRTDEFYFN